MSTDCLFCKIVAGEIPAAIIARRDRALAFRDIDPKAPTHVLVIPTEHYPDAASVAAADPALVGELVALAADVAAEEGIAERGYRLTFNTGQEGGQTVFHCHLHLTGGRAHQWPPG